MGCLFSRTPARRVLSFAPECPVDRLGVEQLLSGQAPATCVKLIQRVRVRTAVALASENKKKLRKLFLALLDFAISSIARRDGDLSSPRPIDRICPTAALAGIGQRLCRGMRAVFLRALEEAVSKFQLQCP